MARRRGAMVVVGVVLTALVIVLIGYRAFAPRDSVQPAQRAYPGRPVVLPEVYGALLRAPLLVDGRLRVYAAQREVWADQPATDKSSLTPYWSLRRWPQQLQGVVAVGTTVVSLWSDARVYGTDARTGRTLWQTLAESRGDYFGRRTGAATLYNPPHMTAWGPLVIIGGSGARETVALNAADGTGVWGVEDCPGSPFTAGGVVVCPGTPAADGPATAHLPARPTRVYRADTGKPVQWLIDPQEITPFGCAPASAGCAGFRAGGRAWLVSADGTPTETPALASPQTWLVGDVVVTQHPDGSVTGAALADGQPLWRWADPPPPPPSTPASRPATKKKPAVVAQVIAEQEGAVHILTAERDLVTLDPADGLEKTRFSLVVTDKRAFALGYVYAAGGFVFIERLRPHAKPGEDDAAYYFPNPGVLVTGS